MFLTILNINVIVNLDSVAKNVRAVDRKQSNVQVLTLFYVHEKGKIEISKIGYNL